MGTILVLFFKSLSTIPLKCHSRIQYQAYLQQQQQQQTSASNNAATIAAPSQLYSQPGGKQPQTSSNSNASNNAPPSSNWQAWFDTK